MLWLIFLSVSLALSLYFLMVSPPVEGSHHSFLCLFLSDGTFSFLLAFSPSLFLCFFMACHFLRPVIVTAVFSQWDVSDEFAGQYVLSPSVCVRVCACFRTGTGQCHAGAFPRPNSSCERQKGRDRERNTGSHCALMSSLPPFLPQFYHWDSIVCSGTVTLPQLPSFENEKETNMFSVFPTFVEDLGACVCILTCCFKCFKPWNLTASNGVQSVIFAKWLDLHEHVELEW